MCKSGDKVKCRHFPTGPEMLVRGVSSATVTCFWFDQNNAPREFNFREEELEPVGEPQVYYSDDRPAAFGRRGQ